MRAVTVGRDAVSPHHQQSVMQNALIEVVAPPAGKSGLYFILPLPVNLCQCSEGEKSVRQSEHFSQL
jgi:hypothetical protein